MTIRYGLLPILVGLGAWAWLALASWVFCSGIGRDDLWIFPYFQWGEALAYWGTNWWVKLWIGLSAVAPTCLAASVIFAVAKMLKREKPGLYGDTGFADAREKKAGGMTSSRRPF